MRRQLVASGAAVTTALAVGLAVSALPAVATHVQPVTFEGNPTCSDLVDGGVTELKVDPGASGTFTDGTLTVTIAVTVTDAGPVFDWTSNIGVDAVFSKGGPIGGNLYVYDPEATADTGLHSPVNPKNNKYSGLSHISFCYDKDATTKPPTPSETPSKTPTEEPTKPPTTETPSMAPTTPGRPRCRCRPRCPLVPLPAVAAVLRGWPGWCWPVLRQRPGPRWSPGAASCMTPDPTHHPAHRRVTRGPARFAAGLALAAVLATIAIAATRGPDPAEDPAADPGALSAQHPPATPAATPTPTPPVEQSEVPLDPADSQAEAITGPYTLRIPRIGVDAPVVPIHSTQDRVLLPPRDPGIAGWWSDGAAPGAAHGSAVLVGHTVRNNGGGDLRRRRHPAQWRHHRGGRIHYGADLPRPDRRRAAQRPSSPRRRTDLHPNRTRPTRRHHLRRLGRHHLAIQHHHHRHTRLNTPPPEMPIRRRHYPGDCCCRRQRMAASRKSSISPSRTACGLPTSCSVRRSLTI